jgi:hypothetical protein
MKFEEEDRFAEDRSDEGSRQLEVGHPVEVDRWSGRGRWIAVKWNLWTAGGRI